MTDHKGEALNPGDSVIWYGAATDATATVLRAVSPDRYLIQLDPNSPRMSKPEVAELVEADTVEAGLDPMTAAIAGEAYRTLPKQEPQEVDGDEREYSGDGTE